MHPDTLDSIDCFITISIQSEKSNYVAVTKAQNKMPCPGQGHPSAVPSKVMLGPHCHSQQFCQTNSFQDIIGNQK